MFSFSCDHFTMSIDDFMSDNSMLEMNSDVKTVLFSHTDVRQLNPDISRYPF